MLTLSLRHMPEVPLEVDCLAPQKVADVAAPQIAKLRVRHGRHEVELGDFFHVRGDAHDLHVIVEGDCSGVKWLGAGMTQGHMTIIGAAGMHAGSGLTGGELEIRGDADDWLAAEMRGGIVRVTGNAGHHAGAAYPGGRRGMRGGTLL
ncbi:MAG: formylmethanofuran dehydrogenase subunit C, partial [Gemmataceae bacterium]|nr:formylmethanofuran dehydrogenase subunit C [Gemmataceae bacterium]